ncbi:Predicted transcriptional regulator YheO, contains PAS and DNA-binding HTH domains [Desulfotomaculum arcticum]|uniref:Predicted transcriptional regulator YheO, contains PAS and DNA-binding HTH domains n=1 Tax=Desulfotruncus arcticus DSM 17038 TaxID=1121424 RepID=A0A1I2W908_9FIRM|nr:PAS domain-containing protein [Desulfotruncus arcticus]SFG97904.1 Predicted transcriptional regulator YheO, contains PAS and DNA-binding HTH domains [Desulfotomaculum arcticum] [Desulfotruncus arcticus DSM 17038]
MSDNSLVNNHNEKLNDEILKTLFPIADSIAESFGKFCEVVIHDLRKPEASILHIAGDITRRSVGAPVTNIVLENLRKYGNRCPDLIGYKTVTKDGIIMKSSTIYIRNKNVIIGALCINIDITLFLNFNMLMEQFISFNNQDALCENNELFVSDVTEILDTLIEQEIKSIGLPVLSMQREDKIKIVSALDLKGVFLIKGAVDKVASVLGVSRYTIYNYIDQDRSNRKNI